MSAAKQVFDEVEWWRLATVLSTIFCRPYDGSWCTLQVRLQLILPFEWLHGVPACQRRSILQYMSYSLRSDTDGEMKWTRNRSALSTHFCWSRKRLFYPPTWRIILRCCRNRISIVRSLTCIHRFMKENNVIPTLPANRKVLHPDY